MPRDLPPVVPVTVTTPGGGAGPGEVLSSGRPPRPGPPRAVSGLAAAATAVLAAGLLVAQHVRRPTEAPRAAAPVPPFSRPVADDGITATATLGGAPTGQMYTQRLTLTVVLEPYDGRGEPGLRLLGDEVALVDVRLRGFAVVPDDRRTPVPLGRFGRSNVGRATTVPLEASLTDCSIEPQARRDIVVLLRSGEGPVEQLGAAVQPELVRALDRVVSRTCRRPRG